MSPKQFKQILCLLRVNISDEQLAAITRVYANKLGDVEYLRFLADSNSLVGDVKLMEAGAKRNTYVPNNSIFPKTDFTGAPDVAALIHKIKEAVYRQRIRLGEFFQDHDTLRKGVLDATKFRTVLYAQKLQLTQEEYQKLEDFFRDPENSHKIRWFDFNECIEKIFTEKDLEKFPTKTLADFKVPSILDPRN